jgi:protein-disulfide isomerase
MKKFTPFLIIAVVAIAAVIAGLTFFRNEPAKPPSNSNDFYSYKAPPGAQPPHSVGPESAAVTLEEFGDYQCPPCGAMFPEVKKIENEYGDRVRFIFRQNPLAQIHKNAVTAAHAAEAAGLQGRFWAMHDKLYENQDQWKDMEDPRPAFIEYARSIGLDTDKFTRDLSSQAVDDRLSEDNKRGRGLGVQGTPTFFVNGKELKSFAPDNIRAAINSELNAKK